MFDIQHTQEKIKMAFATQSRTQTTRPVRILSFLRNRFTDHGHLNTEPIGDHTHISDNKLNISTPQVAVTFMRLPVN